MLPILLKHTYIVWKIESYANFVSLSAINISACREPATISESVFLKLISVPAGSMINGGGGLLLAIPSSPSSPPPEMGLSASLDIFCLRSIFSFPKIAIPLHFEDETR